MQDGLSNTRAQKRLRNDVLQTMLPADKPDVGQLLKQRLAANVGTTVG